MEVEIVQVRRCNRSVHHAGDGHKCRSAKAQLIARFVEEGHLKESAIERWGANRLDIPGRGNGAKSVYIRCRKRKAPKRG